MDTGTRTARGMPESPARAVPGRRMAHWHSLAQRVQPVRPEGLKLPRSPSNAFSWLCSCRGLKEYCIAPLQSSSSGSGLSSLTIGGAVLASDFESRRQSTARKLVDNGHGKML